MAIGGSLGQDKAQMHEVVDWTTRELERVAPDRPRHLLGIGEVDDLIRGVELGIDTFDCAMPTRLGRHGVALVADPDRRWRNYLVNAKGRRDRRAAGRGLRLPGLRGRLHPRLRLLPAARSASRPARGCSPSTTCTSPPGSWTTCAPRSIEGRLAERAAALRAGAPPRGLGDSYLVLSSTSPRNLS